MRVCRRANTQDLHADAETHMANIRHQIQTHTHSTPRHPCVPPRAPLTTLHSTPSPLRLASSMRVPCMCARGTECCFSVWRWPSCHDVVCTAHCSHTKLYMPHYKSVGRDPEKVNTNGKIHRPGDGVRACMRVIMCRIDFTQRCIIFLNYLARGRWKPFG